MAILQILATCFSTIFGAINMAMTATNHHWRTRRDCQIDSRLRQADAPGLSSQQRFDVTTSATSLITWSAAQDKYPSRTNLVLPMLTFLVMSGAHCFFTFPLFTAVPLSMHAVWVTGVGMIGAVVFVIRRIGYLEADFSRQKLSQVMGGADIDELVPLIPTWAVVPDRCKPDRFRNPRISASQTNLVLDAAWEAQLRDQAVRDPAFSQIIRGAKPNITDCQAWELVATTINPYYVNAAIKELATHGAP